MDAQWLLIFLILLGLFGWGMLRNAERSSEPLLDRNGNELPLKYNGALGTHEHGLGIGGQITLFVITETEFYFTVVFPKKKVVEQFPHKNLKAVEVQDAKQVSKRITATRLAALGPFALAVPKTETAGKAYLMIEWEDETGLRQAMFSEEGPDALSSLDSSAASIRRQLREVMANTLEKQTTKS